MKIGYARVSTTDQDLSIQIKALKEAGCTEIFSESISAKDTDRTELNRLLNKVREGDIVIVYKVDRIARKTLDLITIAEALNQRKVDLVTLDYKINTTTPLGKAFFHMSGVFAELERDLIRERTSEGRKAAKEKGVKFGKKIGSINKRTQEIESRVIALFSDAPKFSTIKAAKTFNATQVTINKILKRNGFKHLGQEIGWKKYPA